MQRFLLATFLFLSGGLSAQVDSFIVEGKMFKFEIPQDWVLEGIADGLVNNRNGWNLILSHAVQTKKVNAKIYVGFRNYFSFPEAKSGGRLKPEINKIIDTSFLPIIRLEYLNGGNAFHPDKWTNCDLIQLNDSVVLQVIVVFTGPRTYLDTITQTHNSFSSKFRKSNRTQLFSLTPLGLFTSNYSVKAINIGQNQFKYRLPDSWNTISTSVADSLSLEIQYKSTHCINSKIRVWQIDSVPFNSESCIRINPARNDGYFNPNPRLPTIWHDTIAGRPGFFSEVTANSSCKKGYVDVTLKCYVNSGNKYKRGTSLAFEITFTTNSLINKGYYEKALQRFASIFIYENIYVLNSQ